MLHPGQLLQRRAALGQRDEEDVAAQVRSENGEKLGSCDLAVAHDLDGRRGGNAEAGIVAEKVTYTNRQQHQPTDRDDQARCRSNATPKTRRDEPAANRDATTGAQKGIFFAVCAVTGSLPGLPASCAAP